MKKVKFKIRASGCGKIMTEPRLKSDKEAGNLSETAKSYCKEWLINELFNRKKDISNKYTEKGNNVEDSSIQFLVDNGFLFIAEKNEISKENKHMKGTCDVLQVDEIWDVKNSWDLFTFPIFDDENKNKDYYWQAQVYMELYNRDKYKLAYILSNTPQHLIDREIDYTFRNSEFKSEKEFQKAVDKILKNHIFDDIKSQNRVKIYEFKRDKEQIKAIIAKVGKCQEYINELILKHIK